MGCHKGECSRAICIANLNVWPAVCKQACVNYVRKCSYKKKTVSFCTMHKKKNMNYSFAIFFFFFGHSVMSAIQTILLDCG